MTHLDYEVYDNNDLIGSFDTKPEAEEAIEKYKTKSEYNDDIELIMDEIESESDDLRLNYSGLANNDANLLVIERKIKEFRKKWQL